MKIELADLIKHLYDRNELSVYDGITLARHHVFSSYNLAHRKGRNEKNSAEHALVESYKYGRVDLYGGKGIGVEILFLVRFGKKLNLIPALDCGDHTDFVGEWDGEMIRFDVTTQLNTKNPEDFRDRNQIVVVYDCESKKECWRFYAVVQGNKFKMIKELQVKDLLTPPGRCRIRRK